MATLRSAAEVIRAGAGVTAALVLALSCNYKVEKTTDSGAGTGSPVGKASISFQVVHDRVLVPRCLGCHSSSGGLIDLETYESVIQHWPAIERVALVEKTMPKDGPLSPEESATLQEWVEAGKPRDPAGPPPVTTATPTPSPMPTPSPTPMSVPLEPKFNSIKANIFVVRCLFCHSPTGEGANVKLDTSSDLLNSPRDLVLPGNPDESGLVIAVERKDSKRMPPPKTGDGLSAAEIKTIRDWIQNGAPD